MNNDIQYKIKRGKKLLSSHKLIVILASYLVRMSLPIVKARAIQHLCVLHMGMDRRKLGK